MSKNGMNENSMLMGHGFVALGIELMILCSRNIADIYIYIYIYIYL
jgi:hypothetical protein